MMQCIGYQNIYHIVSPPIPRPYFPSSSPPIPSIKEKERERRNEGGKHCKWRSLSFVWVTLPYSPSSPPKRERASFTIIWQTRESVIYSHLQSSDCKWRSLSFVWVTLPYSPSLFPFLIPPYSEHKRKGKGEKEWGRERVIVNDARISIVDRVV